MEIIERILGCLLLLVAAPFASAENHALNPGMEEVREVTDVVGEKISQPVACVSQTFPYCSATREPANVRSGKGALEIPADAYLLKKIPVVYGDVWKFSFWAKGEGKLRAIIFEYDDIMPNPIWHPRHAVWMLTNEWQQCTCEYSPTALLAERAQRVPTTFIFNLEIRKPSSRLMKPLRPVLSSHARTTGSPITSNLQKSSGASFASTSGQTGSWCPGWRRSRW